MRYHYNYNYEGYDRNQMMYARLGDGSILAELIRPDINRYYKSIKALRSFFVALIPICMILFMGGGILMGVTEADSFLNLSFLPVMLLGFFGFGLSGALMGFFTAKAAKIKIIVGVKDEVEAKDKTKLDDLTLFKYTGKSAVILVVKKLIETDNLRDYEIIGEVGVARTELRAKERDFGVTSGASSENINRRFKCPNCGAAITEKNERFCIFCGTRLE